MDSESNSTPLHPNGKPINGKLNFWQRFATIEQELGELHQCRSDVALDSMSHAVTALVEAVELIGRASNPRRRPLAKNQEMSFKIVRWPAAFARVLIDAGVKCDESRREAARRYQEVLDDLRRHESQLASVSAEQQPPWQDSVTRWRRQLTYQQDTLSHLGVTINAELIGQPFDPSLHEVVETATTQTESAVDTIAEVKRPLLTWRDENGTPQCVPALVVLYTLEKP